MPYTILVNPDVVGRVTVGTGWIDLAGVWWTIRRLPSDLLLLISAQGFGVV